MTLTIALARTMLIQATLSFALLFLTVLISQLVRLGALLIAAQQDPIGFGIVPSISSQNRRYRFAL